jgi:hypothetical protein
MVDHFIKALAAIGPQPAIRQTETTIAPFAPRYMYL